MQGTLEHAAAGSAYREGNAYWMGFGPVNVGLWRMAGALEVGDHERAVAIAEGLRSEAHPNRTRRAAYWLGYGRALARVRGRYYDAVMAFHQTETISPVHLYRNPLARDALAKLVERSPQDAAGQGCGGWLTGLVCRCSPSEGRLRRCNARYRAVDPQLSL
jgi:hypothetical protein